ncbi:MAG: PEP-CTERM sorting domain-containing protein [bacterium]
MRRFMKSLFIVVLAVLVVPVVAEATSLSVEFQRITDNSPIDIADQLALTIFDDIEANSTYGLGLGPDEVLFTFMNNVGIESSITSIYIDDGTILGISMVYNNLDGVDGSTSFTGGGASPVNLPGGQNLNPPFEATASFCADARNPHSGINDATDILGIVYQLQEGTGGFTGIESAIQSGALRFGLHVTSIGGNDGESDGFVNTPVPEPSTILLFCIGFLGIGLIRRRGFRK